MTLVIFYFYYLSSLRAMSKMDPHSFNYSMKNVPVPSNENYELEFLNSIHTFSSRCQWRAALYGDSASETGGCEKPVCFSREYPKF